MTYLMGLWIAVVDVDACEYFVKTGSILRIDNHLVLIKIHENLLVILPDLQGHLQQLAEVVDVHLLKLKLQFHLQK